MFVFLEKWSSTITVLPYLVDKVEKAGGGRPDGFPNFSEAQYQWFHYYEMAKRTRKHCNMMKARGVGQMREANYKFRKIGEH